MLPAALVATLGAPDPEAGPAYPLTTVDADGWPHVALLSAGELLVRDPGTLRLALHAGSGTTASLRAGGRGTLLAVLGDAALTVRLQATALGDLDVAGLALAAFEARVVEVREHRAPYARLRTGITFELTDPDVPERWRATRRALGAC